MEPLTRRGFLRTAGVAGAAWLTPVGWLLARAAEAPGKSRDQAQSIILLWLQAGPSQLETFDPQPGTRIAGGGGAIDTAVKGLQISEYMPVTAKHLKHIALLRSMSFKELAHERAALLAQIGMAQSPFSGVADMGTIVAEATVMIAHG